MFRYTDKIRRIALMLSAVWLFSHGSVYAAENNGVDYPGESNSSDLFLSLLKVTIVLIVIIGLIYGLMKFLSQKNNPFSLNRGVKFLGGVPLGQNKSLQIMEIGNNVYIVGVAEQISLIDKLSDDEEIAAIRTALELQATHTKVTWRGLINRFLPNNKRNDVRDVEDPSELDFQQIFQQKVKRLNNRNQMLNDLMRDDDSDKRTDE